MLSRVCWQTRKEHRLERIFCFLLEIDVLLHCWRCWQLSNISPFLPTPLFWQTGDLPNIRVHTVSAIFCAPYFLELSVWLCGFSIDKITIFFVIVLTSRASNYQLFSCPVSLCWMRLDKEAAVCWHANRLPLLMAAKNSAGDFRRAFEDIVVFVIIPASWRAFSA